MLKYILKRLLIFIPTLLVISFLTFIISTNAPGDPVDSFLRKDQGEGMLSDKAAGETAYRDVRHRLGFDLPQFYFSFTNATYPDTLYKLPNADRRNALARLSWETGGWDNTCAWYHSLLDYENKLFTIKRNDTNSTYILKAKSLVEQIAESGTTEDIDRFLDKLVSVQSNSLLSVAAPAFAKAHAAYNTLIANRSSWRRYIPTVHWYGTKNQYHRWLFGEAKWFGETDSTKSRGFLRGDFGLSYTNQAPVGKSIRQALPHSIFLSLLAILLAYILSVPIGVRSAIHKGKFRERLGTTSLFMLYSLPNFWVATMCVIFFCGGDWFGWFPSPGAEPIPDDAPFGYWLAQTTLRMILPLICATYGSLALISRQMRGGMLNVLGQDYIRTARAKGLPERVVVWKHALRNSLLPIITLFANAFPAALSGVFIIEFIFNIPGMGSLTYNAILSQDYPIIFTVLFFSAILTLTGMLVADILYALVDPRISYSNKRS